MVAGVIVSYWKVTGLSASVRPEGVGSVTVALKVRDLPTAIWLAGLVTVMVGTVRSMPWTCWEMAAVMLGSSPSLSLIQKQTYLPLSVSAVSVTPRDV